MCRYKIIKYTVFIIITIKKIKIIQNDTLSAKNVSRMYCFRKVIRRFIYRRKQVYDLLRMYVL